MGEKDNPWGSFTGETMFTPTNQINFTPQTGIGDLSNMGTNMQTKDTFINRFNGKAYNFMDKLQNSKAGQAMGNVGAVVGGIVGVGASTYQNWKPQNVDKYDNQNKELQNNALSNMNSQYRYGSGSTEGLLSQVSTQQVNQVDPITGKVSFKDLRPTKGQQWANVGKSTLSGAMAGMKIAGPWGALVGGAVGGISAGLGSLFGRKKAKKEAERINNERIKSNYMADYSNSLNNTMNTNALNNAVNNQRTESVMNQQANYHAFGGGLSTNEYAMANNMLMTQLKSANMNSMFTPLPAERKGREIKTFAEGGPMGISEINNGGTHEQNPYQGVPIGIDNMGNQNFVEEGEVVWRGVGNKLLNSKSIPNGQTLENKQDYVFSNRMKPSDKALESVDIASKNKGKSYADIAKELYKEAKERPNDPITRNTINANLGKLRDLQEVDRAKKEMREARKAMAKGMAGMMGNGMNPAQDVNQMQDPSMTQQVPQEQSQDLSMYNRSGNEMMGQQYACGGKLHGFGDPIKRWYNPVSWFKKDNYVEVPTSSSNMFDGNPYANRGFGEVIIEPYNPNTELMGHNGAILNNASGDFYIPPRGDEDYKPTNYSTLIDKSGNPPIVEQSMESAYNPIAYNTDRRDLVEKTLGVNDTPIAETTNKNNPLNLQLREGEQLVRGNDGQIYIYNSSTGQSWKYGQSYSTTTPIKVTGYDENTNTISFDNNGKPTTTDGVVRDPENRQAPQDKGIKTPTYPVDFNPAQTWMRYVPVFGGALSVLRDQLGKDDPDYSLANKIEANANRGTYLPVNPSPIGDYLQYNPFDINYATNKLNAQSQATRRGILNASNGNRATAMANMLGADWNAQLGLGEMQRQAYDYNLGQRKTVGEFNKDTNKFNSTQDFEAQRANQQALASLKSYNLQGLGEAARLKYQMYMDNLSRKHANLTSFLNNVGAVGQDNMNYNMAMSNPAYYYGMDRNGKVGYKFNNKLKRFEVDEDEKTNV